MPKTETPTEYQSGYIDAMRAILRLARDAEGRAGEEAESHRNRRSPSDMLAVAAESRRAVWETVSKLTEDASLHPPALGEPKNLPESAPSDNALLYVDFAKQVSGLLAAPDEKICPADLPRIVENLEDLLRRTQVYCNFTVAMAELVMDKSRKVPGMRVSAELPEVLENLRYLLNRGEKP